MEEDEPELALVMPFVVTKTNGGHLDDDAFVRGAQFGQHQAELKACPSVFVWCATVSTDMVPQYDLLAMHLGFVMTTEPWTDHPDEWTFVTFARPDLNEET